MEKIKQLLELLKLLNDVETPTNDDKTNNDNSNYYKDVLNKRVIIRSYDSGVHYGTLNAVLDKSVTLTQSKRIHYWEGANSLTDIVLGGIDDKEEIRVTNFIPLIIINNVIEIIPCTDIAIKDLDSFPVWSKLT